MKIVNKGSNININGISYNGNTVTINDRTVIVDGVEQGVLQGKITVSIDGDVESIEAAAGDITCNSVGAINLTTGNIDCGDVSGSVETLNGDIDCGKVNGSVKTMNGDVYNKEYK